MRDRASLALAVALALLCSGCINVAYRPLVEQVMGRSPSGLAEEDVERYFDQLQFAQLDLQLPGRLPSRFILMSRDGSRETWTDAAGVMIVRQDVFNFSSRGLNDFHGEVVFTDDETAPQLEALVNGDVETIQRARFLKVGGALHEQVLTYRYKARSTMEVGEYSVPVHVVEEWVRDTGRGQWVNEHWLLTDGLYNVRSVVRMAPEQKASTILVRKMPTAAQ